MDNCEELLNDVLDCINNIEDLTDVDVVHVLNVIIANISNRHDNEWLDFLNVNLNKNIIEMLKERKRPIEGTDERIVYDKAIANPGVMINADDFPEIKNFEQVVDNIRNEEYLMSKDLH